MDLCGEGGALVNLTIWKLIPKWLDSERTRPTFSEHVLCIRVGQSVESALIALAAIFWLIARILTIFDKNTVF